MEYISFCLSNSKSFQSWERTPDITSVRQISIDKVEFPAITICPVEDNRFGPIEYLLDEYDDSDAGVEEKIDVKWGAKNTS